MPRGGSGARPCASRGALVAGGRGSLSPFAELNQLLPCGEAAWERVARGTSEGVATRGAAADALVVPASRAKEMCAEGHVWPLPRAVLRDAGEKCAARGTCRASQWGGGTARAAGAGVSCGRRSSAVIKRRKLFPRAKSAPEWVVRAVPEYVKAWEAAADAVVVSAAPANVVDVEGREALCPRSVVRGANEDPPACVACCAGERGEDAAGAARTGAGGSPGKASGDHGPPGCVAADSVPPQLCIVVEERGLRATGSGGARGRSPGEAALSRFFRTAGVAEARGRGRWPRFVRALWMMLANGRRVLCGRWAI